MAEAAAGSWTYGIVTAQTSAPVRSTRAAGCVPRAGGWTPARGLTSRVALPLMPVAALPRVLAAAGLDWRLKKVDPARLERVPGTYCWACPTCHGVIYIGIGKDLAGRCQDEASWLGGNYFHAHALAADRSSAELWAGPVHRVGPVDPALERWLTAEFRERMSSVIAASPPARMAETLALRATAWLASPAPANAVQNDPRSSNANDDLAWALAQLARPRVSPALHPANLLHPAGLAAVLATVGLSVIWSDSPLEQPGLLAHVDGTMRRRPDWQPLLRLRAAGDPRAEAAAIAAEDSALARLLRDRSARVLTGTVRRTTASRLPEVLQPMWGPYAAAAEEWLTDTEPLSAAATLAARVAVHAGSLSMPATPTSAWALSSADRPADHLAELAVALF